jgi:hypothetical protein
MIAGADNDAAAAAPPLPELLDENSVSSSLARMLKLLFDLLILLRFIIPLVVVVGYLGLACELSE